MRLALGDPGPGPGPGSKRTGKQKPPPKQPKPTPLLAGHKIAIHIPAPSDDCLATNLKSLRRIAAALGAQVVPVDTCNLCLMGVAPSVVQEAARKAASQKRSKAAAIRSARRGTAGGVSKSMSTKGVSSTKGASSFAGNTTRSGLRLGVTRSTTTTVRGHGVGSVVAATVPGMGMEGGTRFGILGETEGIASAYAGGGRGVVAELCGDVHGVGSRGFLPILPGSVLATPMVYIYNYDTRIT